MKSIYINAITHTAQASRVAVLKTFKKKSCCRVKKREKNKEALLAINGGHVQGSWRLIFLLLVLYVI